HLQIWSPKDNYHRQW
ncbi:RVT_1 domain-containing protein, partial [Cephalotus follicularis]